MQQADFYVLTQNKLQNKWQVKKKKQVKQKYIQYNSIMLIKNTQT